MDFDIFNFHLSLYPKHLHHLIPKMINHLHRNPSGFWFIEWPGNIKEVLPENYVRIEIEHKGGEGRNIKIKKFTQLA